MKNSLDAAGSAKRDDHPDHDAVRRRDPAVEIGSLIVTEHPVGAVLSIGMFVIVWSALPVVRPFLIAAVGLGAIFGAILWVRRR